MIRRATISDDGLYRYTLGRRWERDVARRDDAAGRRILWIMLNPSRADAHVDDPTIRRCVSFSQAWGFGELEVVNLFALRTHDPAELVTHADPVGPDNDDHIEQAVDRAQTVIAAWGACAHAADRAHHVPSRIVSSLLCLGVTRAGFPRHPLYVHSKTTPITLADAIRRTTGACRAPATRR